MSKVVDMKIALLERRMARMEEILAKYIPEPEELLASPHPGIQKYLDQVAPAPSKHARRHAKQRRRKEYL